MAYSQYFNSKISILVPQACIVDNTPPTFSGISGATPNTDGSITAAWSLATDATPPISYRVYIALGSVSAGTLFQSSNLVTISPSGTTSKKVFTLADQTTYLVNGQQYTMGVRAVDAVGNSDTNTALQTPTAIASGNLPSVFQTIATNLAATEVLLAGDHTNFQADHVNFQADHADFQADHVNFQSDHADFVADLATLNAYLTTLATDIADLEAQVTAATALVDALQVLAASQAASGTYLEAAPDQELYFDITLEEETI